MYHFPKLSHNKNDCFRHCSGFRIISITFTEVRHNVTNFRDHTAPIAEAALQSSLVKYDPNVWIIFHSYPTCLLVVANI